MSWMVVAHDVPRMRANAERLQGIVGVAIVGGAGPVERELRPRGMILDRIDRCCHRRSP